VIVFLLFIGVGAALIGLALALRLGTSPKRAAIFSPCGVLAIVTLVVVAFLTADRDASACHECNAYQGRYLSPLVFFFAALNVAGWCGGVALGSALRGTRAMSDADRFYGLTAASVAAVAFVVLLLIAF
jgi:hypothetical protein